MKPLVTSGFTEEPLKWGFGGPVCGDFIAGGFPSQKVGFMFSFVFARMSCLTNSRVASELKSHDAYAMSLLCEHQNNYVAIILKV